MTFLALITPLGGPSPGQPPDVIWGGGNVPMPTPPIYLPVVPPHAEHPIYIPVFPEHPIYIPPPVEGQPPTPSHPIVLPPVIWPPQHPAHPIAPGGPPPIASQGPGFVTPPIYIPVVPPPVEGQPPTVESPIYFPVYPSHPIVIPNPGEPTHPIVIPPELPPGNVNPDPGVPGFWGYSVYYNSPVFVPNVPSTGFPPPYVSGQPVPPQPTPTPRR